MNDDLVVTLLTDMRLKLESGKMKARQYILQQTVNKVEVGRKHARLHYQFPLNTLGVGDWLMPSTGIEPKPNIEEFEF